MKSVNNTVSFKEHILKTGTASVQEYSAEHDNYVRKSQLREIWGRFCKNRVALLGLICLLLLIAMALFADVIAPEGYDNQDLYNKFAPPSAEHWFGTDNVGRDIFDRVVHGSRISLTVGMISVSIAAVVGILLGSIAGYYGGKLDAIIMRILDIFVAFPFMVLAIAIVAILGNGVMNLLIAMWIVSWPPYTRLVRSEVLIAKNSEYVQAAKTLGYSDFSIIMRHILPNVISSSVVYAASDIVMCIMTAASMSFLGLGVPPNTPEWGAIISNGKSFITGGYWWISTMPGVVMAVVGLGFSLLGDGLNDLLRTKD